MRERPNLSEKELLEVLRQAYARNFVSLEFLPVGYDPKSAAYKTETDTGEAFFVKLRMGQQQKLSHELAHHLRSQQIEPIISPLCTTSNTTWAETSEHTLALYPFINGQDAYTTKLTGEHLRALGRAIRQIHELQLPAQIVRLLPEEDYSPGLRILARKHVERPRTHPRDAVCEQLDRLLDDQGDRIDELVRTAERLAQMLLRNRLPAVLCHADLHAGNLLIEEHGQLHIVDWDFAKLAPKERDLMFIGSGLLGRAFKPEQEQALFLDGYGDVPANPQAMTYYRYDRILEDVALFCEQIRGTSSSDEERRLALEHLKDSFLPGHCVEIALNASEPGD